MVIIIMGILLLSLPVGIVGSKFQDAYNDLDREPPKLKHHHRRRDEHHKHERSKENEHRYIPPDDKKKNVGIPFVQVK